MFKRYALRHASTKTAMVETVKIPPRLIEWTEKINDVHLFEHEKEAQDCADYIKKVAFNVEVFELEVEELDYRIITEEHRRQCASDSISDKYGIERTIVKITR